ncbi:MAG: amino acid permease, partial [Pirellulales bacterium]|nr:amino acid permease [Pirellulales bacterium]
MNKDQPYHPPAALRAGTDDPAPATSAPRAPLDLLSATSLVAASMIGAGIFTTSGFTLGSLQSPWWVMAAWVVASVIAICGAICYGALATHFTESGGEYLFLSRALHPVAGMMAGWVSLLAGFTGAIAFAATAFGQYLLAWLPSSIRDDESAAEFSVAVIASAIILLSAVLHTLGVKTGARVQDSVVILKFVLIAAFAV